MNTEKAIALCKEIEMFAPKYGCHIALTGGCLYKNGERKDCDILFYRIRQVDEIDHEGLKQELEQMGFEGIDGFGWLLKGKFNGEEIDMFFPEEIDGGMYGTNNEEEAA